MKKLLVLALVLSMASMANAALTLDFSATAAIGDVTFSISGDGTDGTGTYYLGVVSGGGASIGIGSAVVDYTGNQSSISWDDTGVAAMLGLVEPAVNIQLTGTPAPGQSNPPLSGMLVHGITLTISQNATVQLYDGDGNLKAAQDVTTPEPITIGLLGLGAMFLRRRK